MPEKTLEQIDAELEKKYFSNAEDVSEDSTDSDDDIQEESAALIEESEEEEVEYEVVEDVEEEEQEIEAPKKEDKQEYAWKELRTQNQTLQQQLKERELYLGKFERMAKELGYNDAQELLKKYEEEETEKEAKDKGVDPAFYKEFKSMQKELETTKTQKIIEQRNQKIQQFVHDLDSLVQENGLTNEDKTQIVRELEADGYGVEDIIAIKSPKKLIAGYMVDKIAAKKVQSKLKTKKEAFVDDKHDGASDVTTDDLEKQIADEMKAYARSQGYKI